ncbi:hypothetical protein EX30DRAFT_394177 [Ascodesmis nigricans]|uniref:DASH complex subunit Hsk3 like-domain-containing protein n=1 Tax=Ascodesmis nigricans TaxID=341454 RepID=A0A4V3SJ78_9PEZI|nr:hypothetical protein EX30DRAFT_394177 [Ascodesmis nigricans]
MAPPANRPSRYSMAPVSAATSKARQLSHLHSQLAQLQARLADLEDISRTTAVQAKNIQALGTLNGALFMGAAKVLGDEGAGIGGAGREGEKRS